MCVLVCTEQTLLWLPLLKHDEFTDIDYSPTCIESCDNTQYCCVSRRGKRRAHCGYLANQAYCQTRDHRGWSMHRHPVHKAMFTRTGKSGTTSHLLSLTMSIMCMCLHTFKAKHPKSKIWTVTKQITTVRKHHFSIKHLKKHSWSGNSRLLVQSSDISEVLMVVLAVYSFLFLFISVF